jgi:hypothetical protein
MAVDMDGNGKLYVTGYSTASWGTPRNAFVGNFDAYAAALDGEGTLLWNTFLGGSGIDYGEAIKVNGAGNIYVAGYSETAWGAPWRAFAGFGDAFAAGLDNSGALVWNTFLGGKDTDEAGDLALDPYGNAYITGYSGAAWGVPVRARSGSYDVFVAKLGNAGRFLSAGALDGQILESTGSSSRGGSMSAIGETFLLGDDAWDRQYRSILSFNTGALPDTAVITKAVLKIKRQGIVGTDPSMTHKGLMVDIRMPHFGAAVGLEIKDFQAASSRPAVGTFNKTPAAGAWYSALLGPAAYPFINRAGTTQLRLRFGLDDNDDRGADYLRFYSGNAATASYRPLLLIEYYVP